MRRLICAFVQFAIAACLVALPSRAWAQADAIESAPAPGGGTGLNAVCIQVGDLETGAFTSVFWLSDKEKWEERSFAKPDAVTYSEVRRTEEAVEIWNASAGVALQFDFVRRKARTGTRVGGIDWTDRYYLLNATDSEGGDDCLSLASRIGSDTSAADAAGNEANRAKRGPVTIIQNITIKPGVRIRIVPGTQLTAVAGPPCPGQPDYFLCPNKFSCAPKGGVCCPGVGACAAGSYCDRFSADACIAEGNPRFCTGTGDPATGISLHCAIGSTCLAGNVCDP